MVEKKKSGRSEIDNSINGRNLGIKGLQFEKKKNKEGKNGWPEKRKGKKTIIASMPKKKKKKKKGEEVTLRI